MLIFHGHPYIMTFSERGHYRRRTNERQWIVEGRFAQPHWLFQIHQRRYFKREIRNYHLITRTYQ